MQTGVSLSILRIESDVNNLPSRRPWLGGSLRKHRKKYALSVEMVNAAGALGKQWLYHCFRIVWNEKRISEDSKLGLILPIFKRGDIEDRANYRGSFICHCGKST